MPSPAPGRTSWARRCAGLVLALVLPLAVSACRSGVRPVGRARAARAATTRRRASPPTPCETRTTIHRVYGRLPDARRKVVRTPGGPGRRPLVGRRLPRRHLPPHAASPPAFPGFTAGAEERARADKALLTNQTKGPHIDSVTARHRAVSLDILADGPAGASR